MGWAIFWAIFTPTHLVTLSGSSIFCAQCRYFKKMKMYSSKKMRKKPLLQFFQQQQQRWLRLNFGEWLLKTCEKMLWKLLSSKHTRNVATYIHVYVWF
jgi:hypothetical protein